MKYEFLEELSALVGKGVAVNLLNGQEEMGRLHYIGKDYIILLVKKDAPYYHTETRERIRFDWMLGVRGLTALERS